MAEERSRAWAGWIAFAAMIMIITSLINIFQGMVALLDDERVVATPDAFVLVDITSWGWALVLFGVVMLAVGGCLLAGMTWARIVAIIVVGLHAVSQVASLGAYPIWSLLMIALDTVVLFALTARWSSGAEELRYQNERRGSPAELAGDPLHGQLPHETPPLYGPRVS
ncbi:DUF7144 family membrane protein [Actinoplanes aureus]|jgi:hypothetical protein|uniref:DUF7144 domain-containing protein n=1 Tax=Actinoplanes aureus TaxID=2792083 RepID=A0A931CAJ7_9ACTN|nr:hypothetical protein [Actinoplanes aureus]MBG0561325.1 hypothetical protein [Actinoplanes aureus]